MVGARPELYERDRELATLDSALADALAGRGRVVLIQGPPGIGKTSLLDALARRVPEAATVLRARGGELERNAPLAAPREWFEPVLARLDAERRAQVLAGAASRAAALFGRGADQPVVATPFAVAHGLYWLIANLCELGPLVLLLDDAHWTDDGTQRFLGYLLPRVEELPLLVGIAVRTRELDPGSRLAAALAALPGVVDVQPGPLSRQAARAVIGGDAEFSAVVQEGTGGNPLLLRAVASALRAAGVDPVGGNADRVQELAGRSLARIVTPRLHRLGPDALAVARAAAIVGEEGSLADVTALAELRPAQARDAAEALVAAEILQPDGIAFTHPLVRATVLSEVPPSDRAAAHLRAARQLRDRGADAVAVARHLLATDPVAEPWAGEALRQAATEATRRGAAESAIGYLERALAEPLEPVACAAVRHELGWAGFHANHRRALDWMADAVRGAPDAAARAAAWLDLLFAAVLRGERVPPDLRLREPPTVPAELGLRFAAAQLGAYMVATVQDAMPAPLPQPDPPPTGATDGERTWLAAAALRAVATCEPASRARELAVAALTGGRGEGARFPHSDAAFALMFSDGPASALPYLEHGIAEMIGTGSLPEFQRYTALRGIARLMMGELRDAAADLLPADQVGYGWVRGVPVMVGAALDVLREQGQLDAADELAGRCELADPARAGDLLVGFLLDSRGRLHATRSRFAEALADFRACRDLAVERGVPQSPMFSWRAGAAHCLAATGERDEALQLARDQVAAAERFGAPVWLGSSLRVLGVVAGGQDGLGWLRESVELLAGTTAQLELAHALCDLGVALRRAKYLVEAREPLRQALDLAQRCAAAALTDRAETELLAAGARPRRRAVSGADALTPAERRVATLAAQGLSNREIAQSLFVTRKTVEKHLGNAYLKLAITSRSKLAAALT